MLEPLLLLCILALIIWVWFDTLRCQEIARGICKHICQQHRLQLLDDTVTLRKTRVARTQKGSFCFKRYYSFDFSDDGGDTRIQGLLIMRDIQLEMIEVPDHIQGTIMAK